MSISDVLSMTVSVIERFLSSDLAPLFLIVTALLIFHWMWRQVIQRIQMDIADSDKIADRALKTLYVYESHELEQKPKRKPLALKLGDDGEMMVEEIANK